MTTGEEEWRGPSRVPVPACLAVRPFSFLAAAILGRCCGGLLETGLLRQRHDRQVVVQGHFRWLQTRPPKPEGAHGSAESGGRLFPQRDRILLGQKVCLRVQGQKQHSHSRGQAQQDQSHLGEGDPGPRKQRHGAGQIPL